MKVNCLRLVNNKLSCYIFILKIYRKQCKNLNRNSLWSDSQTRDLLTKYAEGLACVRFDTRDSYDVRYYREYKWLVMAKENTETHNPNEREPLKFERCRLVQIINGYMTCTCGDTQQYLMPCRHMCSVIKEKKYLVSQFYDIRWFKTFGYYYLQSFSPEMIPTLNEKLINIHMHSIKNDYSKINGQYKGIYCYGTAFYNDVEKNYEYKEDDIFKKMQCIRSKSLTRAVIQGSIKNGEIEMFDNSQGRIENMEDGNNLIGEYNNQVDEFASQSQTEFQFSQQRQEMSDREEEDKKMLCETTSTFKDAEALFKEVFFYCKNQNQIGELMQCIRSYGHKLQAKNKNTIKEIEKGGMVMYGTKVTKKRKIKRFKSSAEKRMKRRLKPKLKTK